MDNIVNFVLMALSELQTTPERKAANVRRITVAALYMALAVIAAAGALACAAAAFWIFLASIVGELGAAVGCTFALFVVFVILLWVARNYFYDDHIRATDRTPLGDELLTDIEHGFQRHKAASLLAAVIAGFAAGHLNRRR